MQYSVEISELAEKQYDDILYYLANVKMNPQAVQGLATDRPCAAEGHSESEGGYPLPLLANFIPNSV